LSYTSDKYPEIQMKFITSNKLIM